MSSASPVMTRSAITRLIESLVCPGVSSTRKRNLPTISVSPSSTRKSTKGAALWRCITTVNPSCRLSSRVAVK
jgi:hypothetical protein